MAQDTPEYEQLALYESLGDEPALYSAMQAHLNALLPDWVSQPGNTENVLLESMVTGLALDVMAARMVDTAMVESLMGLYGIVRDPGAQATSKVRVTVLQRTGAVTIPEGTVFQLVRADTEETVEFETTETVTVIPATSREAVISVVVNEVGDAANDIAAGAELDTDGEIDGLEPARLETAVVGGRNEESDDSFLGRATAILSRQTSTLATAEHFQYAALEVVGVGRAMVLDLYNPAAPDTLSAGHVTVAVADEFGEPLTSQQKELVQEYLEERALASLTVHVIDPTYTTVDIQVSVLPAEGFTGAVVQDGVKDVLAAWLHPSTWPWAKTASTFQAAAVASQSALVAAVMNVSGGGPLAGAAPLARAGVITVTVVED